MLRQLARVLADTRRANDVVARYGGEEFAVILVDTRSSPPRRSPSASASASSRTTSPTPPQKAGPITVSFGVATFPDDGSDAEALVRAADTALYAAKRAGRNRVVLYTEALGVTPSFVG